MLQLIDKILLDACDTGNELAAIDAFRKLRKRRTGDIHLDESASNFSRMCCYAIHELYPLIGVETGTGAGAGAGAATASSATEKTYASMLIDILFVVERPKYLKKYLSAPADERIKKYRRICDRAAAESNYSYYEPCYVSRAASTPEPVTTTTTALSTKYVGGRQLVTIKTVIEHEVSMYIDVNVVCPKFIKIFMPHLEEPIYISKVMKKYVKFAKLFDGKAKENTLSYYYKYNNNESVLEFIDEDMESEVAEILGVNILEKELIDEETALAAAAEANKLTDQQVADFKAQLEEVRWNIRNAV